MNCIITSNRGRHLLVYNSGVRVYKYRGGLWKLQTVKTTMSGSEAKLEDKREAPKKKPAKKIDNSKYDNDY